ncbi:class I SAM-dependent methyltransferase [Desulfonatronospira sp. MSAO_Bac3]|uniref:class I SAM-dependent methyltransferase n=1 Tax=Desulfonatronospira sp. MSAO_Bac3 TaxID=2293857 RepID=UPI000FF5C24C|nr:class I SAM-dependent methyltransferase [Desulfonatronospira sp. MSAO_Bac3]RQD73156.1 MAG: class I SAM-dependent methyltransferase [Desulfonatronospira sp. MSAO_Bac3]
MGTHCRVCLGKELDFFYRQEDLVYWSCSRCQAVLLDEKKLPDAHEELKRYQEHNNYPVDAGYRNFLNRLASPLLQKLPGRSLGLDYGCGPGPALSVILKKAGHRVELYDPFFYPDKIVLEQKYGFITCSEVVEHFHRPYEEFVRLDKMLCPGGWLGIMTCFFLPGHDFGQWHYRRDPTHVVFYQPQTFHLLAGMFGWSCEIPVPNVVLMQKNRF